MKSNFMARAFCLAVFVCCLSLITLGAAASPIHFTKNYSIETPQIINNKTELMDIFLAMDKRILSEGNEQTVRDYLANKNREIALYLSTNYPKFGSLSEIKTDDPDFVLFGLVYALSEKAGYLDSNGTQARSYPAWVDCVADILGLTSVYELISGAATATYSSTWAIIKKLAKRYAGWIGVAYTLYEIATECF